MADNYFYYPDATTPTTTLQFDVAGHLLENSDITLAFNQSTAKSKGGSRYAMSFGPNESSFLFSVIIYRDHVTSCDRADVIAFMDIVLGAVNSFVWRDEDAVDRTVKIVDGSIKFQQLGGGWEQFTCNLEVQS